VLREEPLRRSIFGILALAMTATAAHAEGETPAVDGRTTQTYIQVAQGATPVQPASPTTPGDAPVSRLQVCGMILDNYRKVLLQNPEMQNTRSPSYNGLVGVSMTIARHETLGRLMTMANNQSCDIAQFLKLEARVIQGTYTTPEAR
jgi:hypothetical protein